MVEAYGLGALEMRILGMLREDLPSSVGAVRDRLAHEGTELAYTTVMTVLTRLQQKGLAVRAREGNRYLYKPARRAPRVLEGMLGRVRQALFPNEGIRPILTLIEDENLSTEDLRELRRLVDRKIKEAKDK